MIPCKVLPMMTSSEDSTMAASRARSSSARLRTVMSWKYTDSPPRGGVDPPGNPGARNYRGCRLELGGDALLRRPVNRPVAFIAGRPREHLQDVPAHEIFPGLAPESLRFPVHVNETPLPVECEEPVADALQDGKGFVARPFGLGARRPLAREKPFMFPREAPALGRLSRRPFLASGFFFELPRHGLPPLLPQLYGAIVTHPT